MEQIESKWFDLTELSNRLAEQFNANPEEIREIFKAGFSEIAKEVGRCERLVVFDDLGTFRLEGRQARKRTNPQTGEPIEKPAYQKLKFKPAKVLREEIEKYLPAIHSGKKVK